jgi:ABC-type transport system involved in multi-copper enzyme maturation permease subunit
MWTLICAEWLKAWKRPANRVLALVVLVVLFLSFAAVTITALADGAGQGSGASAQELMRFPHGFRLPLLVLSALGPIIGIVFMANSVGSEYSGDTWKVLLPRRGRRIDFIVGKLASGLFFMTGLIVGALVLGQALGLLGAAVLGDGLTSGDSFSLPELLRSLAPVVLQIAVFAAITLLVTVLSRSAVLGIVFGFVCTLTFGAASALYPVAARILPNVHLSNLQARWQPDEGHAKAEVLAQVTSSFGMEVTAVSSALVIAGYVVGCIAIALAVFHRRDVAGQ